MQLTFQDIRLRLTRPLRFGLVGLSGIAVNSAILWALARDLGVAVPLASAIATEVSILTNFLLNDRWTFRGDGGARSPGGRLLRYNGVALGGLAITAGLLTLLTASANMPLLAANLLAIGAATGWNYVVNSRWTWARPTTDHQPPTTEQEMPTPITNPSSVIRRRSSVVGEEVAL